MRQIIFTFLLLCSIGLLSCRKNKYEPDIKEYDDNQIKNYIAAHGLTGMQKANDTTGIYYQILTPGKGAKIDYPDLISLVFTIRSLDGSYINADTIYNHTYDYLGHLTNHAYLTKGVMLGLINQLQNKGGRMRLLVPSHLAYGVNGAGSGSSSGNNRLAGNLSLDYYLNLIDDQAAYDDIVVKNYLTANNLSGYTPILVSSNGHDYTAYYKITQAGTGGSVIGPSSTVDVQYTATLFNGAFTSDLYNTTDGTGVAIDIANDTRRGLAAALQYGSVGAKMSIIMPSSLAYDNVSPDTSIPVFSCLRYEVNLISVE